MPITNHGITANTPQNLVLGAGTFYKDLAYDGTGWNGTILGATSGGGTVSFKPEYFEPQIDGATVSVQGLVFKVGEEASIKATVTEFSNTQFTDILHLVEDTALSVAGVHRVYTSKSQLSASDYLQNIGFVGKTSADKPIIFILQNAICLGALEFSPQDKQNATYEVEFKGVAPIAQANLNYIPYQIYLPQ
ncbi:MAG: hypothetical protein FWF59_11975 [Turicibacter sp.]|nr:hypothetical protein [Turicibacter sp.]